eukprot:gene3525-7012_t
MKGIFRVFVGLRSCKTSTIFPKICHRTLSNSNVSGSSYGSTDSQFDDNRILKHPGDPTRREFTYFLLGGARIFYASAARLALIKFIANMSPSQDVLALASAEFNLDSIQPGSSITVKWRGKPVFIRHRTEDQIKERVTVLQWLIVVGVCTHLGCVPIHNAGDYGAWFCPCHGSHYDMSGRIPAVDRQWTIWQYLLIIS